MFELLPVMINNMFGWGTQRGLVHQRSGPHSETGTQLREWCLDGCYGNRLQTDEPKVPWCHCINFSVDTGGSQLCGPTTVQARHEQTHRNAAISGKETNTECWRLGGQAWWQRKLDVDASESMGTECRFGPRVWRQGTHDTSETTGTWEGNV